MADKRHGTSITNCPRLSSRYNAIQVMIGSRSLARPAYIDRLAIFSFFSFFLRLSYSARPPSFSLYSHGKSLIKTYEKPGRLARKKIRGYHFFLAISNVRSFHKKITWKKYDSPFLLIFPILYHLVITKESMLMSVMLV